VTMRQIIIPWWTSFLSMSLGKLASHSFRESIAFGTSESFNTDDFQSLLLFYIGAWRTLWILPPNPWSRHTASQSTITPTNPTTISRIWSLITETRLGLYVLLQWRWLECFVVFEYWNVNNYVPSGAVIREAQAAIQRYTDEVRRQ